MEPNESIQSLHQQLAQLRSQMDEREELAFISGTQRRDLDMLNLALQRLGIENSETKAALWVVEKMEIIQWLRYLDGSVDWTDGYLPDLIYKHLIKNRGNQ